MLLKNLSKTIFIVLFGLISSGCMPRGETITLDQSLDIAKERFSNAMLVTKGSIPSEVAPSLDTLKSDLERLAAINSLAGYQQESKGIADTLRPLLGKAGYTSRVSLDEILKQYVVASEGTVEIAFSPGTAKLLAQRTYHVLSAELENTRFSL